MSRSQAFDLVDRASKKEEIQDETENQEMVGIFLITC